MKNKRFFKARVVVSSDLLLSIIEEIIVADKLQTFASVKFVLILLYIILLDKQPNKLMLPHLQLTALTALE